MNLKKSAITGAGWSLDFFGKGNSPLLARNFDPVITALNALGKIRIKVDRAARAHRVLYSEGGILFLLAGQDLGSGGIGDSIKVVKIKTAPAESANTITVVELVDGVETGANFSVAKPPNLRGLTGNQFAFPSYDLNDLLLVVQIPGGMGIATEWQDMNVDGRNIARETALCADDGTTAYSKVVRSQIYTTPVGSDFT